MKPSRLVTTALSVGSERRRSESDPVTPDLRPDGETGEIGRVIGKYRLLSFLGEGGMSTVYLAHDEALDRNVAFKRLHRHLMRDAEARTRFAREARAVARLKHRNIPEIFDFSGLSDDRPSALAYLVTEYVDGGSLGDLLETSPDLLPEYGVMVALALSNALSCAHGNAIVHRDVKPENVLIGKDGVVRLTDFGIAQVRGLESMTMTGSLIGSPAHMAPEQFEQSKDIDARADIWGLGTVLYMAVCRGRAPFSADSPHALIRQIVEGHYDDPRRHSPHIDSTLARIITRCLTVDRTARYQAMTDVTHALETWLESRGITDPERELSALMADPQHATLDLTHRLIPALLAIADRSLASRDRSAALECFGRVLLLDPDQPRALDGLRRIKSRAATTRLLKFGLLSLLALSLLAFALFLLLTPPPSPPPPREVTRLAVLPATPAVPALEPPRPEPESGRVFGDALAFELARVEGRLGLPETPEAPETLPDRVDRPERADRPVPVTLRAFPPAVEIRIAGRTLGRGETLELRPGAYKVTLHHPTCTTCRDIEHMIRVPEGAPFARDFTFEQSTALAPASLFVRCEGEVLVEPPGTRYPCNRRHALPVSSAEPRSITLSLLDATGSKLKQRRFTVQPGVSIEWSP